jgi:hypothetical protein
MIICAIIDGSPGSQPAGQAPGDAAIIDRMAEWPTSEAMGWTCSREHHRWSFSEDRLRQ